MNLLKNIKLTNNITLINKPFKKKEYYHFLKTSDLSLMVAEIKKNVFVVVSQKRIPVKKITYEFPSGIIDKSEKSIDAACREFYEETGYKILDKPRKIFTINCEPGRLTTKIHCYYTKKITKLKKSEKGIKTYLVSKDKINKLIFQKKFCNASHIASFLKVIEVPTK